MSRSICIIPARMGSSRFPGKPLEPMLGMPLVLHVYHRCRLAPEIDEVVVATCDQEIFDSIEAAGGRAVMTADTHERCTDRVSEALVNLGEDLAPDDFVLMVQGDEVLVSPEMVAEISAAFANGRPPVVNLVSRLYREADHDDPNTVKVVSRPDNTALYFSRSPIPSRARAEGDLDSMPVFQQTGIIGFRAEFLQTFSELEETPLERIESCDMMRVVEHGFEIRLVPTSVETIGVDTPADLSRAEDVLNSDPTTPRYLSS